MYLCELFQELREVCDRYMPKLGLGVCVCVCVHLETRTH
jgi:hypothetical protein